MSLPFARLAKPGEEYNEWNPISSEWTSQYLNAKARHIAALRKKTKYQPKPKKAPSMTPRAVYYRAVRDGTFVRKALSQTKTAIRLRAKRAGTYIKKTKEEICEIHRKVASDRAIKGWSTRKTKSN